jgi:teichuronic acid biosynthesis glycosyltransferase TuaC
MADASGSPGIKGGMTADRPRTGGNGEVFFTLSCETIMRVGVVSWLYPSRRSPGNGIFVREELDHLSGSAEIRLIAPLHNQCWFGERHTETSFSGYPVIRPFTMMYPSWFFQHRSPSAMAKALSRSRKFFAGCDLVHVHNAFPEAPAAVRAFGSSFPLVVTVHGSDVNLLIGRPSLHDAIVEALNSVRIVICVSRALAATLRENGVTAETVVIPNGIVTPRFSPGDRNEACRVLGLDPGRPRILFAGNFAPWKGVEFLIRAMPETVRVFPDCELVLLGAKPGTGDFERYGDLIRRSGGVRSVRVCGWVPSGELPAWFRASDVFALPSLSEGFGIVAAEALACGIPVVATRSGGPEDIVGEGQGYLVPTADEGALANALVRALNREGLFDPESLSRSAVERFSYSTVTRRILNVYERVTGRGFPCG